MKLCINDLKKEYDDFSFHLDFEAEEGSFITLLGPSGSGKSTALQLISGLLQQDSGTITLGSIDFSSLMPWERDIGFVFQDYALFPHMNIRDNIAYGITLKNRRIARTSGIRIDKAERVSSMLEMVGLANYEERMPSSLSGGEQQRVALARALAPDPKLLLLDEPLSALDAPLRCRLREEIRSLQQELNVTTIYVTHDRDEALSMSDLIVVMDQGSLVEAGPPRSMYCHPKRLFTAHFLGEGTLLSLDGNNYFFRPENGILADPAEEDKTVPDGIELHGKLLSVRYYGGWASARFAGPENEPILLHVQENEIDRLETHIGEMFTIIVPREALLPIDA
jgi:thiamine transport system ATP-binding protein